LFTQASVHVSERHEAHVQMVGEIRKVARGLRASVARAPPANPVRAFLA